MIPFRDVIPSRATPVATVALILLHALAFLVVPSEFVWWHPIAPVLLHDGWIHLICNLWALWLFGDNVEGRLGHWRFLLLYLVTALAGALIEIWAAPSSGPPIAGTGAAAAGAIAGVMGGYFLLYPRSRILVFVPQFFSIDLIEVPAVAFAGIWLATQLFLNLARLGDPAIGGGVTLLSIVGGLVTGLGLVWLFGHRRHDARWWDEY
jgi:membrane associated rhomboid family serine protease